MSDKAAIKVAKSWARIGEQADMENSITEAYSPLVEAAQEMLLSGAHDGPCNNEDDDGNFEDSPLPCTLHLAAAERRRTSLRAALKEVCGA